MDRCESPPEREMLPRTVAEPVFTPDFVLNPPPLRSDNGARCAAHPDNAATANCTRCGTFICALDTKVLSKRIYCETCAARPDVNYLEAFRLKYWGKRDSWAWLYGIGAVGNFALAISLLIEGRPFWAMYALLGTIMGGGYFLGMQWARYASLALPVLLFGTGAVSGNPASGAVGVLPFIMAVGVFFDTRNRLFFKVPVTEKSLQRSWDLYANNQMARNGMMLGIASLLMFPLAPFGLACSIIGLMRVDPNAWPPIGKRAHAIVGLVASSIGLVICAGFLVSIGYRIFKGG
ncbi:MAG: hypothetical protein ACJ790_19690 [Myxococcaceae bacterium]